MSDKLDFKHSFDTSPLVLAFRFFLRDHRDHRAGHCASRADDGNHSERVRITGSSWGRVLTGG